MRRLTASLCLLLLSSFLGCDDPPDGRFRCTSNADCPQDYVCRIGVADRTQPLCYSTRVDDAGVSTDTSPD